jgi:HK97 family phage major capsid protein
MNKLEMLKGLIEKSTGDERKKYEDQLIAVMQEEADAKAEAKSAEKAANKEREAMALKANANESPRIEVTSGDRFKGVKVKEVMAKMAENVKRNFGSDDYMKGKPEAAEFVATFWIDKALGAAQQKANELITTTTTLGGNLTPTEQESAILDYVRYTSVALQDSNVMPMTSDIMTVPVQGTVPAVTIESAETSITQSTPTFNLATVTSKRHSGYIPVSWELEADNTANLSAYLADKFYEQLGIKIDSAVFLDSGSVVDGSGVMISYGVSGVMASGSTNFSAVHTGAVFSTVSALYPERRVGAKVYVGYDNMWAYLAKLTYGTDMPLFSPMSNTLLGYPVRELRQAVATGSGKPIFVLGNLKNFIIGSRLMNTQLIKIPEKTGMTNFIFFTRLGYSNPLTSAFSGCKTA